MDGFTSQDSSAFQRNVVWVDLDITLGTSGATSGITPAVGDGILSIVSGGSGVYTITFQHGYDKCLGIIENIIQAAYSASGAVYFTWTTGNAISSGLSTVVLTARTAAGAAVQPATGDRLLLNFRMRRTAI